MKKKRKPGKPLNMRTVCLIVAAAAIAAALLLLLLLPHALGMDENWVARLRYAYLEDGRPVTEDNQLSWEDMAKVRRLLNEGYHLSPAGMSGFAENYGVLFTDPDGHTRLVLIATDGSHRVRVSDKPLIRTLTEEEFETLEALLRPYFRETPLI